MANGRLEIGVWLLWQNSSGKRNRGSKEAHTALQRLKLSTSVKNTLFYVNITCCKCLDKALRTLFNLFFPTYGLWVEIFGFLLRCNTLSYGVTNLKNHYLITHSIFNELQNSSWKPHKNSNTLIFALTIDLSYSSY